jgi:hypothetical protein
MIGGSVLAAGAGTVLLYPQDANASGDAKTSKIVVGSACLAMGLLTVALGVVLHSLFDTSVRVQTVDP